MKILNDGADVLILFFCENANQVDISHEIARSHQFPGDANIKVVILDWQPETIAWVVGRVRSREWDAPIENFRNKAPALLRKAFDRTPGPEKLNFLVEMAFEGLKTYSFVEDLLLVQFNDTSSRGRAVANAARALGLKRLLVQDGFLTFQSKQGNLMTSDTNYGWGSSAPDRIAVWGETMKRQTVDRNLLASASVEVVGPTKFIVIPETVAERARCEAPRILWADQSVIDQAKADRGRWLEEFGEIATALAQFNTTLKFHPSVKVRTAEDMLACLPDGITVMPRNAPPIRLGDLAPFDCVVTYYSTVFLDCLAAGIPCVILRTRSLDIELPPIAHPLLVYCDEANELPAAVDAACRARSKDAVPADIKGHISPEPGFDNVAGLVTRLRNANGVPQARRIEFKDFRARQALQRLQSRRILVLGTSFGTHIGVGKPISAFAQEIRGHGIDVEFGIATARPSPDIVAKVASASIVIVNSIDVVKTLPEDILRAVMTTCVRFRTPLLIYMHETEYVFERRRRDQPGRFDQFTKVMLPNFPILAVSDRQAEWLRSLGARTIHVVYNTVGVIDVIRPVPFRRPDRPKILMIGTRQARKGVDLFSRVADLAAADGRNWDFVWLGGPTREASALYHSSNVCWQGHVGAQDIVRELGDASAFFLSSIDDPMPLSVGEALASGVPCLVYSRTGFAEFIRVQEAGDTFDLYEPKHAYERLSALMTNVDGIKIDLEAVEHLVGLQSFTERLVIALSEAGPGNMAATPARPNPKAPALRLPARGPVHRLARAVRPVVPNFLVLPWWRAARRWGLITTR